MVDAGFSGEEMIDTLLAEDKFFMMSINRQHKRDLFDMMDRCCPVGHAVNVKDERGVVWSAFKSPLNTSSPQATALSLEDPGSQSIFHSFCLTPIAL